MAWLAGLAATEGRRAGFLAVAGIALGLLANGVLAAVGLAALVQAQPQLWTALRLAGALMMTWLAIEAWRGARDGRVPKPADRTARRAFLTGALINLLNPKAYLFFLVVAPQFLNGRILMLQDALLLAVVSATIATVIHLGIVAAGSRAHAWLSNPTRTLWVRRVFAVVMLGVALSFLLSDIS